MKTQLIAIVAAIALASGVTAASAAEHSASTSKSSPPFAKHSMARPGLKLTAAQKRLTLKDISGTGTAQNEPANFTATVGATVPADIALKPVPSKLGRQVSVLKPYDYALLKKEILIVSPSDKKVVDVINRRA
jgi:Protein of unknown function (DUF1236)